MCTSEQKAVDEEDDEEISNQSNKEPTEGTAREDGSNNDKDATLDDTQEVPVSSTKPSQANKETTEETVREDGSNNAENEQVQSHDKDVTLDDIQKVPESSTKPSQEVTTPEDKGKDVSRQTGADLQSEQRNGSNGGKSESQVDSTTKEEPAIVSETNEKVAEKETENVTAEDSEVAAIDAEHAKEIALLGTPIIFGTSAMEAVREIRFRIEQKTKLTASAGELTPPHSKQYPYIEYRN